MEKKKIKDLQNLDQAAEGKTIFFFILGLMYCTVCHLYIKRLEHKPGRYVVPANDKKGLYSFATGKRHAMY